MHELRLLGGLTLIGPSGVPGGRIMQRRRLAVLAALAVAGPRGMSRDRLVGLLWPESDTDAARHLLADCVYVIRQALVADAVLAAGDDLRLNPDVIWSDVVAFETALAAGDLEAAVGLYGGPLLDGFVPPASPDLEHWLDAERTRLARRHADALAGLAAEREAAGDPAGAVVWLRRLAAADPFDTRVAARLIRALTAAGDPAGALRHARVHELLLRDELALEPGPELAAAQAEARECSTAGVAAPATPELAPVQRATGSGAAAQPLTDPAGSMAPGPAAVATSPASPAESGSAGSAAAEAARRRLRPATAGTLLLPLALLLVLAVLAGRQLGDRAPAAPAADGLHVVAVLPFGARGAEPDPVVAAVHVLLATRMDGSDDLLVLDPNVVAARLSPGTLTPQRAATAAAPLGASSIILGYAVLAGDRIELSASRYTVSAVPRRLASAVASGPAADILTLVDRLAGQLLVAGTSASTPATRTAAMTTASLTALGHFLEGEAAYRDGRLDAAAAAYADAIREDTTFALAYLRLAVIQEWSASADRGRSAAEQALRHAARLPARARHLVAAHEARARGDFAAAERLYRVLLERYPDDAEGWNGLGETLFHGNPGRGRSGYEAREPFERARALGLRTGGEPVFHLISIAAGEERIAALDSLLAEHDRLRPDSRMGLIAHVQRAVLLQDSAELARLADRLRGVPQEEAEFAVLLAALGTTRLAAATRLLDRIAALPHSAEARMSAQLLRLQLTAGRWQWGEAGEALAELESLDATAAVEARARLLSLPFAPASPEQLRAAEWALRALTWDSLRHERRLYLGGLLQLRLDRADAALDIAHALERRIGERAQARAAIIRALVERRSGRPLQALQRLEVDLARAGGSDFRLLRGQLLLELGSPQEALGWLHAAAVDDDAILFLAEIEARLAQAHRALGRHDDADWHMHRFTRIRTER